MLQLFQYLPDCFAIEVSGKDAQRYLQARMTNDIRLTDTPDNSILSAILDSNGKTQGVFTISKKQGADQYILIADGGEKQQIITALLRFKVADRVDTKIMENTKIVHLAKNNDEESRLRLEEMLTQLETIKIPEPVDTPQRTTQQGEYILYNDKDHRQLHEILRFCGRIISSEEALALRIKSGRPVFPNEISDKRIFIEAQLNGAISRSKGCYAGQEVIERASSRGRPPKLITRVKINDDTTLSSGTEIFLSSDTEKKVGQILNFTWDMETHSGLAFALINSEFINERLQTKDGRILTQIG
jgi:folate-binding protein YgfZ